MMSPVQACPSPTELTDYLLGKLDDQRWQAISDHLHGCEVCLSQLDQIDESQDSMIRRMRHPQPDDAFMQEPECQLAVEMSQHLGRAHATDAGVLRDYQLIEKLGEGGMGTVYRARHTKLDREVAVKLLPAARLRSEQAVSRFQREMKAIGRLHHPNIVQAFDAGEVDGQYYLAMELVSGLDLSQLVQRLGPLPVADACEIVRQVAQGLQHAFENDLVHRDIKPSNVMLTACGEVKILDLGLARLQDAMGEEREVTSTGQIMGTLDYMAPEQLGDSHTVDIRADIYSLGATLYKLLTGRAPYADRRYNTSQKRLMAIATQPALPVSDSRDDIPPGVIEVLEQMLAKDPDQRFATPAEVAGALQEHCQQADLPARFAEATAAGRALDETEASAGSTFDPVASSYTDTHSERSAEATATKIQPMSWRRRVGVLALGMLLVGLVAAGIIFKIKTSGGTVVLECNQPELDGAVVSVDGKKQIKLKMDEMAEPITVKVDRGRRKLEVVKGGFKTFTEEFEIGGGEKRPIKVYLEPLPEKSEKEEVDGTATKAGDSQRRVAQWVLAHGGNVRVVVDSNCSEWLFTNAELPARPFKLHQIALGVNQVALGVKNASGHANFSELDLATFGQLCSGMPLRELWVEGSWFDNQQLAHLQDMTIGILAVNASQLTEPGFELLRDIKGLRTLAIDFNPQVSDEYLRPIGTLAELTDLSVNGTAITDEGLRHLKGLVKLRRFWTFSTRISDNGINMFRITTAHALRYCKQEGSGACRRRIHWSGLFAKWRIPGCP